MTTIRESAVQPLFPYTKIARLIERQKSIQTMNAISALWDNKLRIELERREMGYSGVFGEWMALIEG
jgi:hypothetical protein